MSKLLSQFIPPSFFPAVSISPFPMSKAPWNQMLLEMKDTFGLLWSSFISHPKEKHFPHTLCQVITRPLLEHVLWAVGRHVDFPCPFHSQTCLIVVSPFCNRASTFLLCLLTAASEPPEQNPELSVSQGSYPPSLPPTSLFTSTSQRIPLTDLTAKLGPALVSNEG